MAACGTGQIAAMNSDTILGSDRLDHRGIVIDNDALEESTDIPPSSEYSTLRTSIVYKTQGKLEEAVKRKKEAIERVFKMMHYAEEVDLCFLVDCTGSMSSYIDRVKTYTLHVQVDLCFLVDCTGSMSSYIDRVKMNIKTWNERLRANYKHMKLRLSFVRYTDFDQPASSRTTWIDFTTEVGKFLSFVNKITTPSGVGGDTAEDVFGGLEAIPKLSWRKIGTKVLIHFADAPCHGKRFYNCSISDNHPDGDPELRNINELIKKICEREIQYHFGYIVKSQTSKMVDEFDRIFLERGGREMMIQTFDANEPHFMDESVYHSIATSISASLGRLSAVDEKKRKIRDFELMDSMPEWEEFEPHQVTISSVDTSRSTCVDPPKTPKTIKSAKKPFTKGAVRLAYHAYIPEEKKHVVMKEFLMTDDQSSYLKRFMEINQIQLVASHYAFEFNKEKPSGLGVNVEFATCGIVECPEDMDGKKRYYSLEPYIGRTYLKFNSNNGHVAVQSDPVNDTCQAFSHFTWVKSEKRLVVCDIQGVKTITGVILTDPAIHDKNVLIYGSTNLGVRGIKKFLKSHDCNEICIKMGLERSRHQQ